MKKTSKPYVVLSALLVLAVAGCVPVNTHVGSDLSSLDSFRIEKNKTTEAELVKRLGPPASTVVSGDGSRILTWGDSRAEASVNLAANLPFGFLMGMSPLESLGKSRALSAVVRDGIVVDFTLSDSNSHMKV